MLTFVNRQPREKPGYQDIYIYIFISFISYIYIYLLIPREKQQGLFIALLLYYLLTYFEKEDGSPRSIWTRDSLREDMSLCF